MRTSTKGPGDPLDQDFATWDTQAADPVRETAQLPTERRTDLSESLATESTKFHQSTFRCESTEEELARPVVGENQRVLCGGEGPHAPHLQLHSVRERGRHSKSEAQVQDIGGRTCKCYSQR